MFVHIYLYLDEIEIQRLQNLRQSFGTPHQVIAALHDISNCKLTITSFYQHVHYILSLHCINKTIFHNNSWQVKAGDGVGEKTHARN